MQGRPPCCTAASLPPFVATHNMSKERRLPLGMISGRGNILSVINNISHGAIHLDELLSPMGLHHARSQRLPMLDDELQGDEPLVTMDIGPVRGPDTLGQGVGSIEKDSFEVLVIQRERQAHVLASDRALRRYLEFVVEARPWEPLTPNVR